MIEIVHVTGTPIPWKLKLNPLWWMQTGGAASTFTAPEQNNGSPYLPSIRQQWLRNLLWFFRNPFGNFTFYVIGVADRNFTVIGPAPARTNLGSDLVPPVMGWRWAILRVGFVFLPYVSYSGGNVTFYLGWRPASGSFGLKLVPSR